MNAYVTTIRMSQETKKQIEALRKETLKTRRVIIEAAIAYYYGEFSIEGIRDNLYQILGMALITADIKLVGRNKVFAALDEGSYKKCYSLVLNWYHVLEPIRLKAILIRSMINSVLRQIKNLDT